jgi:hypothetical protein
VVEQDPRSGMSRRSTNSPSLCRRDRTIELRQDRKKEDTYGATTPFFGLVEFYPLAGSESSLSEPRPPPSSLRWPVA